MSCCNGTTKEAFLIQKGKNFREYILKYSPTQDVLEYMEKFNEENLMSSIATLLIPIKLSGTSGVVIGELVKRLTIPEQEADDVKGKIGRYFDMFAEVMMKTA
jgi:hypothetical protein